MKNDLENAGLSLNFLDSAIIEFVNYIMYNRGLNASRLCAKDPNIISHMEYLHKIFPNAKFIYLVRDGRDAAYSLMIQLKENLKAEIFRSYLSQWRNFNYQANKACLKLSVKYCLRIKYEDLVLHPEKTLKKIIKFLEEEWTNELLKHENHIGKDISISKTEWSSHQIVIRY